MKQTFGAIAIATVLAAGLWPAPSAAPAVQNDLNEFMKQVLARRDENWKKLQQYILDEREKIEVKGPTGLPVWGQRREYQWFIRDGYFVRSPLTADGVKVPEDERRRYEDNFLSRAKIRDKREAERAAAKGEAPPDTAATPGNVTPGGTSVEALLAQTRQPQFIDSAYFLKFKFEQGTYALVGREPFEGRDVLRIEYYPTRLFNDDNDRERRPDRKPNATEDTINHLMNKNSLVTLWVEPASKQIVRYTFDNVQLDFLPAAWLIRMEELKASMTMSQPFKDVWLPRDVELNFAAMLAFGMMDIKFRLDYHDYREAKTSGRIKGGGGGGGGGGR